MRTRYAKFVVGLILILAVFFGAKRINAATGINRKINFQGKVVNKNGTNVVDGNYDFQFKLYTASAGGTLLWTETWNSGSSQVGVTNGIFNVQLGAYTTFPPTVDFNSDNLYLTVNFTGDGEMSPRIQLTAVPYAMNAEKVGGLTVTNTTGTLTVPNGKTISFGDNFSTTGVGITLNQNLSTLSTVTFGGLNIGGTITFGGVPVGTGTTVLYINSSGNLVQGTLPPGGGVGSATNGLSLISTSIGLGGTLTQNTNIGTSSFGLNFLGLGNTQGLYISPNGQVGVGTTNPGQNLGVNGGLAIIDPVTGAAANVSYAQPLYGRLSYSIAAASAKSEVKFSSAGATGGNGQTYFVIGASDGASDIGNNLLFGVSSGRAFIANAYDYNAAGALYLGGSSWTGEGVMKISGEPSGTGLASVMGNFGIGTTNPSSPLELRDQSGNGGVLAQLSTSSVGMTGGYLQLTAGTRTVRFGADSYIGPHFGSTTRAGLMFLDNNSISPLIGLLPADNQVDIGTSAYRYRDGFFGRTIYTAGLNIGGTLVTTSAVELNYLDSLNVGLTGALTYASGTGWSQLAIGTSGLFMMSDGTKPVWVTGGGVGTTYAATNGLTMNSNNIGLGGTLTQVTNIGTSSFGLSFLGLSNAQALYISSAGKVGMGTTNPGYTLDVKGDLNITGMIRTVGTSGGAGQVLGSNGSSLVWMNNVSGGSGVSLGTGSPDNVVSDNDVISVNTTGTGNLLRLRKNSMDRVIVNNNGGVAINSFTADLFKSTTGSGNTGDFSLTGSTMVNVTSANDMITLNEGVATTIFTTATAMTVGAGTTVPGAGAHTIQREDGSLLIINGNGNKMASLWDGISAGMTQVSISAGGTAVPGVGAISLRKPNGRYLLVNGGATTGLTYVYDAWGVGVTGVGPAVCGGATIGAGTNAFMRPDGKYVILCGTRNSWGVYDPALTTLNTGYTAGVGVGVSFGAGAHGLMRDDGTFLVFAGGGSTASWIYNPYQGSTGIFGPINPIAGDQPPAIGVGAISLKRQDGRFLVLATGATISYIYDPTTGASGTGTTQFGNGYGPTHTLQDGAQLVWRQDGKYLLIIGSGSTVTNIVDVGATGNTQFVRGPDLPATPGAGVHVFPRPNGMFQMVRGGGSTATDTLNFGFVMGGDVGTTANPRLAYYETECMAANSLNQTSTLGWNVNQEGSLNFQVRTGNGSCNGAYKNIVNSGDRINPATGDNMVQVRVYFKREFPNFVDQEWKMWKGANQTRYRRRVMDPTLYDLTIDNSSQYHKTRFDLAEGVGASADASGPVTMNVNVQNDGSAQLAAGVGAIMAGINGIGAPWGAVGVHSSLPLTLSEGTILMQRPNGKYTLSIGNTVTANAYQYDPVTQTFLGIGASPTAVTGRGALAIKRPNGTFLMVLGNGSTATNIHDPVANTFIPGPDIPLGVGVGRGSQVLPLPNGRQLIVLGGNTTGTVVYDAVANTMTVGPPPSGNVGGVGSLNIPRPNGTYLLILGFGDIGVTNAPITTTTNLFDPYAMQFTATGAPATVTGTGAGAFALQRRDGAWLVVSGGGTTSTYAGTNRTMVYNPVTNRIVAGPTLTGVAQMGAFGMQRPDGSFLIAHGGNLTTSTIYWENDGTALASGVPIGSSTAGPVFTAISIGGMGFQRADGKYVIFSGGNIVGTQTYDAGFATSGYYRSEQLNVADLDVNSTLSWKGTMGVSAEVKTAPSQALLQAAAARNVVSGGLINPAVGDSWVQVQFNFKRTIPNYTSGAFTDVWYNGQSNGNQPLRQILNPTLSEFKLNKDTDMLNLRADGVSMFRVSTDGDIYTSTNGSVRTGGADLAENYSSTENLEKGELVTVDPLSNHSVKRSQYQYQRDLVGVVSSDPGFVAGNYTEDSYPIALVGRVPVLVSTENGPIKLGDKLTSSSMPGYAMRATKAGQVIGKTLEPLDESKMFECPTGGYQMSSRKCGKVMVFVNLAESSGEKVSVLMEENKDLAALLPQSGIVDSAGEKTISIGSGNEQQEKVLAYLKYLRDSRVVAVESELLTDKVNVTKEIISPQIVTDLLLAKKIKADSIEGLEVLTGKLTALETKVASSSAFEGSTSAKLAVKKWEFDNGIVVGGDTEFSSSVLFKALAEFIDKVVFRNNVEIAGDLNVKGVVVSDNKDLAGKVKLGLGERKIEVKFDRELPSEPVVQVTPLGLYDFKYAVTSVDTKCFVLEIDPAAEKEVEFAWSVSVVKQMKTIINPTPTPTTTPTVTLTPTTSQVEPTTTVTPIPESPTPTLQPTPISIGDTLLN